MKKKTKLILMCFILIMILNNISIANSKNKVYVIPIHGEINGATKNFLISNLEDIKKDENVAAIIFEIDTYGGLVDKSIEMKDEIIRQNVPTISYVNNKAESAGVLLTIASEKIVMSKNSTIGSAETIPNTEKVLSMWKSVLRDTAQLRGREEIIIQAMADRSIVIPGLTEADQLVNLTSKEAYNLGVSDYVASDYEDILKYFNLEGSEIIIIEEGFQVKLAKYISNPYVSSFILTVAFIGLVIEIISPNFGLGGIVSILGFGLYFGGNILAGHSNWTSLVLFVTGFLLLVVELLIPGFGLAGISGIILAITGLAMAMESLGMAVLSIGLAITGTIVLTIILLKFGLKTKALNNIILDTSIRKKTGQDFKEDLIGMEVQTLTTMRPSGYIEIEGRRVDALSEDGLIESGKKVRISRVEGSKIFVRRL